MRTISYLCQHVCHFLLNELIRGKRTPKLLSAGGGGGRREEGEEGGGRRGRREEGEE